MAGMEDNEAKQLLEASKEAIESAALAHQADRARAVWTEEEDELILEGVRIHGLKWRTIVEVLPGRSDSAARNRWLRLQKDQQQLGRSSGSGRSSGAETPPTQPATPPHPGDALPMATAWSLPEC